jgi:hypothetical protein
MDLIQYLIFLVEPESTLYLGVEQLLVTHYLSLDHGFKLSLQSRMCLRLRSFVA